MTCVMMAASLTACSANGEQKQEQQIKNDVAVTELTAAVAQELGENYWPQQKVESADIAEMYGLNLDNIEEVVAEVPMMSVNADLLLIAKAKDGKVEEVKKEVEAFRQSQVDATMQYPMNVEKIAASSVQVVGNYVVYVQLGGDAAQLETEEEIRAACEEDNKKAMEVIEQKLQAQKRKKVAPRWEATFFFASSFVGYY